MPHKGERALQHMTSAPDNRADCVSSTLDVLRECQQLLDEYGDKMNKFLVCSAQQNEPRAIMFQRALEFARRTLAGMEILIEKEKANALLACTLCRPFYETAIRLLWASRRPDGWERLQAFYADQDRKWANEAKDIAATAQVGKHCLGESKEILGRTDECGKKFHPAPRMEDLLHEVVEADVNGGLRDESDDAHKFDYTNVYRWLCRPSHGHMQALGRPESFVAHAKFAAVMGTSSVVKAWVHVSTDDPKEEINAVGGRILKIARGDRD